MFCPKCRSEYETGITRCAVCDVPLVDVLPRHENTKHPEPVVILETSNASVIPVVESLLRSADIAFEARGERLQNLFALGQVGGINPLIGPVRFVVGSSDARRAKNFSRVCSNDLKASRLGGSHSSHYSQPFSIRRCIAIGSGSALASENCIVGATTSYRS